MVVRSVLPFVGMKGVDEEAPKLRTTDPLRLKRVIDVIEKTNNTQLMSSPFLFKPCALAKSKLKTNLTQHVLPHASSSSIHPPPSTSTSTTSVTKPKFSNKDYASLFSLALSDYALWDDKEGAGGFFPLTQLLKCSKVLVLHAPENVQVQIVKALRALYGGCRRLLGAHEIRRRKTGGEVGRYSKLDCENQTIYVENIPSPHHTLLSLHFIYTLLPTCFSSQNAHIQALTFPRHHQDKPNALPTCKGFALVLADIADVEFMLESWPWDRRHAQEGSKDREGSEATKFGFRVEINARQDAVEPLVPMPVSSPSFTSAPPFIAEP
ncbi:hypothetical protein DXG01_011197 [Tephrocybe rancida]|nr:hypothetical protein DXG01_011197 [Tephrocybe rancida]